MEKGPWHLEKTVSLSHIFTTIGLIAAAVSAYYGVTSRLSILEDRLLNMVEHQHEVDQAQDDSVQRFREEMRADTAEIQNKLDIVLSHLIDGKE